MKRLITFLGTGDYKPVEYAWEGTGQSTTPYIADALAQLWKPDEVVVLTTPESADMHRGELGKLLEQNESVKVVWEQQPAGRSTDEQWQQLELLRKHLQVEKDDDVLLDITHGFRAQPFMAGATVSLLQAAGQVSGNVGIVYGEFNRADNTGCIWDLGLYVQLMEWAQALHVFMKTGVATAVVDLGKDAKKRVSNNVRMTGGKKYPEFSKLVNAIERFANDLATVRLASIITGYEQDHRKKPNAQGSAKTLIDAIDKHSEEVRQLIPPLELVLDQLVKEIRPLVASALASDDGQRALKALADYYLSLQRYPEAAVVLREAQINLYAADEAIEVNTPSFSKEQRRSAEAAFRNHPDAKAIAEIRNDIEHGGINQQPLKPDDLARRLKELVEQCDWTTRHHAEATSTNTRTLFVSRHPGAQEWAQNQNISIDIFVTHLDLDELEPGDLVIGTLPVNVIAAIQSSGYRYAHLSLSLTPDLRGKELSAEQLNNCGAKLCAYRVEKLPFDE